MIHLMHYATVECDAPGCLAYQKFEATEEPLSSQWLPDCLDKAREWGWDVAAGKVLCSFHVKAARESGGGRKAKRRLRLQAESLRHGKGDANGESEDVAGDGPGANPGVCLFRL